MSDHLQSVGIMTPRKLNLWTRLAYGVGDLGPAITQNILAFFLLPFLTTVAGLEAGLAGSILAISKVWDAVNDPLVGILSDRTQSRWGRRRPWILIGALPFGISFLAQWLVPFPGSPWSLFWYYLGVAVLFNSFYTAVNLPYTALTAELTQDYDERTQLTHYRFAFSIGGSLVSGLLYPRIIGWLSGEGVCVEGTASPYLAYALSGGIWALIATLPLFWCVAGIRETPQAITEESISIPQQLRIAFSNRPYLFVIGLYLCSWLALQMTATIIPYFVILWMGLSGAWVGNVILAVQGTAFVMLFIWARVSALLGKKAVFSLGMGIWILAQAGLVMLQPGQMGLLVGLSILAGIGVSTAYLVPWAMVPDVIELDELQTGQRREGIFYGFMVLLQKMGLALGLFLVGQLLQWSGFQSTVACQSPPIQPDSALLMVRMLIGPVPTLILVGGLVLNYFYPITRQSHAQVLQQLDERRQRSSPDRIS
jgi:GPH family glycoside/pentoside/hexuronide:cation symporter